MFNPDADEPKNLTGCSIQTDPIYTSEKRNFEFFCECLHERALETSSRNTYFILLVCMLHLN
jgi:hypothetical protein